MYLKKKWQSLKTEIYDFLWFVGELSGCHQLPERSFFLKGYQFPVCSRCTGAFVGYLVGAVLYVFYRINIIVCIIFCLIMFVDWFLQHIKILPSTNLRRFITGVLCGSGLIQINFSVLQFSFESISNLIK